MRHNPMYMSDYVEHLDNVLKATGEKLSESAGSVSHAQAIAKATEEYQKYQIQNLILFCSTAGVVTVMNKSFIPFEHLHRLKCMGRMQSTR